MKAARWELRLFTMLGHYTGQRTRNIVKISLHDLTPEGIRVIQSKTRKPLLIPVHPDLDSVISEARDRGSIVLFPRRQDVNSMTAQDSARCSIARPRKWCSTLG